MLWRIGDYVAQHFESIRSGCKGGPGLETQVATGNVRIALTDIGWIGDNQIEAPSGDRREPVAFLELDMTGVMLRSIFLCNRQSLWRHIDTELITIDTKHEGSLSAYRLNGIKGPAK